MYSLAYIPFIVLETKRCGNITDIYHYIVRYAFLCGNIKAAVLQNILKIISYKFFIISPQIYIIVVRNKKDLHIFTFCFENNIPTIHKGYCDSNTVDYEKNDVLLKICQLI